MYSLIVSDGVNDEAISDLKYTQLGEGVRRLYKKDGEDPKPIADDESDEDGKTSKELKAESDLKVDENAKSKASDNPEDKLQNDVDADLDGKGSKDNKKK